MSLVAALGSLAGPLDSVEWGAASAHAQGRGRLPEFDKLWEEARHWATETGTAPQDCVFSFGYDPNTQRLASGYRATCDEPYRSPYYPWPAASRPGVRVAREDITRYGREPGAGSGEPGRSPASGELRPGSCGIVVGFTEDGRGAEAIECYWRAGNVPGRRANTVFVVETASGERVTSRLDDRVARLGDREMRETLKRLAQRRGESAPPGRTRGAREVVVQISGKVVARGPNSVRVRGRALPVLGGSATELGVVTADANIVVHYPSDDALRPVYYLGGEHCFKEKRENTTAGGAKTREWVYGPCTLGPDQYWMFEQYPLGRSAMTYGPYRDYGECDRDRKKVKVATPWVSGHCVGTARAVFQMIKDGTLVVPPDAPALD